MTVIDRVELTQVGKHWGLTRNEDLMLCPFRGIVCCTVCPHFQTEENNGYHFSVHLSCGSGVTYNIPKGAI